jgi:hypothetical protein
MTGIGVSPSPIALDLAAAYKGDKGDKLTYADLTEADKADLRKPLDDAAASATAAAKAATDAASAANASATKADTAASAANASAAKADAAAASVKDGKTPVRGTDYWTSADVSAIHSYIDQQIGVVENGAY